MSSDEGSGEPVKKRKPARVDPARMNIQRGRGEIFRTDFRTHL